MRGGARLFLDASVWIAAAGSRAGASALVLELCRRGRAVPVSSRLVLLEAERNIRGKLSEDALLRFYRDIASLDLELVEPATPQEIAAQTRIINPKDVHVLAAAMKGNAEALLTLDRKHFFSSSVVQAHLPYRIETPGDFLRHLIGS